MSDLNFTLDLELWLDQELIKRQNRLKAAFLILLEQLGNSFSNQSLSELHPNSKGKKISKGNDLLGFPYQVLDLIRDFDPETGLNIRVLNWFGNGFYVLVYLGNEYPSNNQELLNSGFAFSLTESPWDYPEMIKNENTSKKNEEWHLVRSKPIVWFKELQVAEKADSALIVFQSEIRNILEILKLSI